MCGTPSGSAAAPASDTARDALPAHTHTHPSIPANTIQSTGVLRGCGRQGQLLVHNVLGFGSGVSAGWWLTFGDRQMGVRGLWLGILGGVALVGE